jgi:hypothetical protein
MPSATIYTNIDAYANQNRQNVNFGHSRTLLMSNTGSNLKYAYLYAPKPFADGSVITSAVLNFFVKEGWDDVGGTTVTAKPINEAWKEGGLTYNGKPGVTTPGTPPTVVVAQNAPDGTLYQIDITDEMQLVADGTNWHGIRLEIDKNDDHSIYAAENGNINYRAYITITWHAPPEPPTDLIPSGDQAVSVAQPTYRWQYADVLGDSVQAKSRLEIDNDSTFATPLHDTGLVANVDPQSTPAYSLTDNTQYYARVMVQDDFGANSDWSETVSFYRRSKGTSSLSEPDASEEEITPDIIFSQLSGRTQDAAEYFLYEYDSSMAAYVEIYHRPKQAIASSGAITHNLPDGLVRTSGRDYKAVALIFDTIDRVWTPGDPPYVELSQVWQFARSGAITGSAALTLTQSGAGVVLDWTRASQPTFWAIRVDGEYIDHDNDGDFRFVLAPYSGTSYHATIYGLSSGTSHTIEVEAVVDTAGIMKHSSVNTTAAITPSIKGIWLVEPVAGTAVQLIATSEPDMKIGEASAVFNPMGARRPIIVTSGVRGYEGSASGIIAGSTYKNNLETMKGQLNSKQLRLIFADINIPVILGQITGPTPKIMRPGQIYYEAEFEFFQNGEFTVDLSGVL